MLTYSALWHTIRPCFRHIVQDKFGTSGRLETANRMAKATPGERHRAHRENGEVGVTQEEPGLWNVQSPVIDDGKIIGKRREAGVYNAPLQRTAPLDIKRRSKNF